MVGGRGAAAAIGTIGQHPRCGPCCPHLDDATLRALGHHHEEARARRRVVGIRGELVMHRARLQRGESPAGGGAGGCAARERACDHCGHSALLRAQSASQPARCSSKQPCGGAIRRRRRERGCGGSQRVSSYPCGCCDRPIRPSRPSPSLWRVCQQHLEPWALPIVQRHFMQVFYRQGRRGGAVILDVGHAPAGRGREGRGRGSGRGAQVQQPGRGLAWPASGAQPPPAVVPAASAGRGGHKA